VTGDLKTLIAIGTSTGGPKALQEVIPYIPEDISAAILIVQHMPPGFTKSLAERLNALSGINVKEGEDGEVIRPGYAYIAPGDFHMEVDRGKDGIMRIRTTKGKPMGGHRPAVNVLMESIARTGFPNVIGVIMTGMGNDGKEGIVKIKESNKAVIICQDEISCVVYGMPKSAVATGMVDAVVPLKEIAGVIVKYMGVEQ
jgi:two-component system chemotaxis response regulator CheB